MARRTLLLVALLGGALSVLPLFFVKLGGDAFYQYSLIAGFAEQLWHGNLFPRWCTSCNGELGSPVFLFYFPLPFYMASLFYPLHLLGLGIDQLYLLAAALAGMITVLTCYVWLRPLASPAVALAGSFLYLWLPYRAELLYQRSAFSELWAMAFIPLIFWAVRHISQGRTQYWLHLALCTALLLLCHVTTGLIILAAALIYLLLAQQGFKKLHWFAASILLALALINFYVVPAISLLPNLYAEGVQTAAASWVNNFADAQGNRPFLITNYFMLAAGILLACMLAGSVLFKLHKLGHEHKHETLTWLILAAGAGVFMFSFTRAIWEWFDPLGLFTSPWRLQQVLSLAIVYCFAIKAQWLLTEKQHNTKRFDYLALLVLLMFFASSQILQRPAENDAAYNDIIAARLVGFPEYQTRWIQSYDFEDMQDIVNAFHEKPDRVSGDRLLNYHGSQWQAQQLAVTVNMQQAELITLRHYYFPTWQAYVDGAPVALSPAPKNGLMQLLVPEGVHDITIKQHVASALPAYARYGGFISLATLLLVLWQLRNCRRANVSINEGEER